MQRDGSDTQHADGDGSCRELAGNSIVETAKTKLVLRRRARVMQRLGGLGGKRLQSKELLQREPGASFFPSIWGGGVGVQGLTSSAGIGRKR